MTQMRKITLIVAGLFIIGICSSSAALAQQDRGAIFTVPYTGEVTPSVTHVLKATAVKMRAQPNITVILRGGDDSTGQILTALGVDAGRISQEKTTDGMLTVIVVWHAPASTPVSMPVSTPNPAINSEPKPTYHADTQTFTCPQFYMVADEKQAGKAFMHCVKDQKPTDTASPAHAHTIEEALAIAAKAQKGDPTPEWMSGQNLSDLFARSAAKGLIQISIGDYQDGEPYTKAAEGFIDVLSDTSTQEMAALTAINKFELAIIRNRKAGDTPEGKACTQAIYAQLATRHWYSTPVICAEVQ
jgi:hypothetical protein